MPTNDEISTVVRSLARYFQDHPLASDTSEGIGQWWLEPSMNIRQSSVIAALEWLTRHDLIKQVRSADGRVRYYRVDTKPDFRTRVLALLPTLENGV